MEVHRVKYFLEVCRWGSFSKAAKYCNISQPSLSQQIKKLEDEVGGQLILRSRDGICLTELGEKFSPYASAISEAVKSAQDFADASTTKVKGKIRLGAIPTIAPYLLPNLIRHTRSHYPEIEYDITETTTDVLIDKLRQGDIDFALLSPPTKIDSDVDHLDLCEDELLATLSLEHPLNKEPVITMESLNDEKLLLLKETHCLTNQIKALCKTSRVQSDLSFSSSQMDTLLGFVELGTGITFTPKMAVRHHTHRKVKFHSISPKPYTRKIQLIWLSRHIPSVTQAAIISCLKGFSILG